MKPLFVVGGLYSEANGVARIMRDLAAALGRRGTPVTVYGAECFGRRSIGHIFERPSRWISARGFWFGGLSWSPQLKELLREGIREADVVHNHSIWMLPNSYSSRIALSTKKPVVITAHGTLEEWAIRHSGWKKRIAGKLFQNHDLHSADCIHVNSEAEIDGVRAYGLKSPVAIIPNGIHLPDFDPLPSAEEFHAAYPATRGRKILLFMARLHVKKGLEHLMQAWSRMHAEFPDWHLVVAGPDCGLEQRAREIATEVGLENSVTFTGNLNGLIRLSALAAADVFALPSFSEGFSMAVLEALACRIPALITPGCNFREATKAGAAVEVSPDVLGTESGLRQLLRISDSERTEMGRRGRELVEKHYTWDRVAEQTLELYQWLARSGPTPSFVRTV
ncbi:MAG: glycosyltransferase [Planctomycetaceae bacterium]